MWRVRPHPRQSITLGHQILHRRRLRGKHGIPRQEISVTIEIVLKVKLKSQRDQSPLGQLVAEFLSEMHRYDAGRTLPILYDARLTTPQLAALEFVRTPGTVSALANHLGLSLPATSQTVQKLVRRRLISRSEGATDRRKKILRLTGPGRSLLAEIAAARAKRFEASLTVLSAAVADQLQSALSEAVHALNPTRAAEFARAESGNKSHES